MPEKHVARNLADLRATQSESAPRRVAQRSSASDQLVGQRHAGQATPVRPAGPTSAPSHTVTEVQTEQPSVARKAGQEKEQVYVDYAFNMAFQPKAQDLKERRTAYDMAVKDGDLEEAKEMLRTEREHVDVRLKTLEDENDELRRKDKIRPRGLVEREVERLSEVNKKIATRLANANETYAMRTMDLKESKSLINRLVEGIEKMGMPSEEDWKEVAGQLHATSVAREAAEHKLVALEREVAELREAKEASRRRDADVMRFMQKLAKPTVTKRAAPEDDDAGGDADAQPDHKRVKGHSSHI